MATTENQSPRPFADPATFPCRWCGQARHPGTCVEKAEMKQLPEACWR